MKASIAKMKLWFIYRTTPSQPGEVSSFVVRETTANKARALAANNSGPEGPDVWTDPEASKCEHVLATGKNHFLVRNFSQSKD